mmetsp:Transcript_30318/g.85515  ORF Transcript_30318/g.85515 Transcript_30318/m.85515 type:complete len:202 (+) Transcript_30318:608-1213(+)
MRARSSWRSPATPGSNSSRESVLPVSPSALHALSGSPSTPISLKAFANALGPILFLPPGLSSARHARTRVPCLFCSRFLNAASAFSPASDLRSCARASTPAGTPTGGGEDFMCALPLISSILSFFSRASVRSSAASAAASAASSSMVESWILPADFASRYSTKRCTPWLRRMVWHISLKASMLSSPLPSGSTASKDCLMPP